MAMHGGRTPYDEAGALTGPARVLYADTAQAVPTSPWDVVPPVASAGGEYAALTAWKDFGLAADAPQYAHDKDSDGLDYEQPSGSLFEEITDINRSFKAQVGHIDELTMGIIENSASVTTLAAAAGKSAVKKLDIGSYASFKQWRIVMISFRPTGSGVVTEPAPSPVGTRPPAVALILPRVILAAEASELSPERGSPANIEVTFNVIPETTLASGKEHGFWGFEQPGVIA